MKSKTFFEKKSYIKTYEDIYGEKTLLEESMDKLLIHLDEIFRSFGFYSIKTGRMYEYSKDHKYCFTIAGYLGHLTFRTINNSKFIIISDYFESIDGLKKLIYGSAFTNTFETNFGLVGNVDNIINQISREELEIRLDVNKYNL